MKADWLLLLEVKLYFLTSVSRGYPEIDPYANISPKSIFLNLSNLICEII